ncbi:coenzyme F430 synthase [Methanolobus mangrovi]|uniref:Coenzyme F430 synthase n=1 Tax=Methanolobus mangrovi TaxID=3072977 RepID=A0AA51YIH0_9EURY|nr:coenzyme F430 synthase [Methanolobus mangrovi]WMW21064.1 coenzyme F430 synthase [Methanolobus mangrovi]
MLDHTNVAVLDLTHAGIIIAEKLSSLGFNVTVVDVYRTVNENVLSGLESNYGIITSKDPMPVDVFDLIVSPAHLYPEYAMLADAREKEIEIMTHHRAVGLILSMTNSLADATVIEVTGSKAKTSSASLLADMLSRNMKVILHTSRGLELWDKGSSRIVHLGLSIAPGSVLLAVDRLNEMGITAECYVFEVSIGLTGFADVGIITTLEPDYMIAASTSHASDSKIDVLSHCKPGEVFFLNVRDRKALDKAKENSRTFFTFSDSDGLDADVQIHFEDGGIVLDHKDDVFSSSLRQNYNSRSYATAFAASGSVAMWMGVSVENISKVISTFEGLQGRMQEKEFSGRKLIDNSNSGMDIRSAERSLDYALSKPEAGSGSIIMVLGEEAAQVCEGLPPENVSEFVSRRGKDIGQLILVGERMQDIDENNVVYACGLEEGLSMALEASSKSDIILSCVKCFR